MRTQKHLHRRRGTMYVAILGVAMVVTVIGVSAIMVTRVEGRVVRGCADLAAARNLAQASVDLGVWSFYNETDWRTTKLPGAWRTNQAAGDGTISLSVADPVDGVFSDALWEPVTFSGAGAVREARYMLEATAVAQPLALPALNTCLHTGGKVTVGVLKNITVTGAPLSINGSVSGPGTITGNVSAGSVGILPIVVGTSTIPSPAKEMPDAGIFALYQGLATTITGISSIDRQVLSAGVNPWGTANADGVYYIDAGATDFVITRARIQGTLLIKCAAGRKVSIDTSALVQGNRPDYPTLIVDGALEISLNSSTTSLTEASVGVNLNPVGSAYLGASDSDVVDTYPNEVQGFVHATGTVTFTKSSIVRGVVIAGGDVTVSGTPQIIHTPTLYSQPPMGYVSYSMQIAQGSWRRKVNP